MAHLTVANQLTLLRMLLIPAFVILVLYDRVGWALVTFVTAGITDKETNLAGFVDVTPLNNVLTAAGKPTVDAAGLDKAQG